MLSDILIALAVLTLFCLSGSSSVGGDCTRYYDNRDTYADDDLFDD